MKSKSAHFPRKSLRARFVSSSYTTHNTSHPIRSALGECLSVHSPGSRGLCVGAGSTRLHPEVINLDLVCGDTIDVCASAEHMPFPDEVFEHVCDPFQAMSEMKRVLKKGGMLYCQVPFIIGYHPAASQDSHDAVRGNLWKSKLNRDH